MHLFIGRDFLHSIEFSVVGLSRRIPYLSSAMIVRVHGAKMRVEISDEIRSSSRFLPMMRIEVVRASVRLRT